MHHRLGLAAVAVAAATLLAACGEDPTDGDRTGSSPTSDAPTSPGSPDGTATSAPPQQPLTTAALLTDADTVYSDGADWFRTSAAEGDGQDVFNPCTQKSLEGTGATGVVRGDYELRASAAEAPEVEGDFFVQVVGQYADEEAATTAYDQITDWLGDCSSRPEEFTEYKSQEPRRVQVDGATAQIVDATYGPVPKELDPTGDMAYIMETGLLRQGDRITVLTSVIVGQDYNFLDEDGGTPVTRMLPKAAARLGR